MCEHHRLFSQNRLPVVKVRPCLEGRVAAASRQADSDWPRLLSRPPWLRCVNDRKCLGLSQYKGLPLTTDGPTRICLFNEASSNLQNALFVVRSGDIVQTSLPRSSSSDCMPPLSTHAQCCPVRNQKSYKRGRTNIGHTFLVRGLTCCVTNGAAACPVTRGLDGTACSQ